MMLRLAKRNIARLRVFRSGETVSNIVAIAIGALVIVVGSTAACLPSSSQTSKVSRSGALMRDRVRQAFFARAEPAAAASWPQKDASGSWHSPGGKPISEIFVLGYDRPKELEGVPKTAFVCLEENAYWVHEGGGISGVDRWFGPFKLAPLSGNKSE